MSNITANGFWLVEVANLEVKMFNLKNMEIDVKKLMPKVTDNHFKTIDLLLKANQDIIEALHIMQSTIENWDDAECMQINKERMIKYFNRFSKDV